MAANEDAAPAPTGQKRSQAPAPTSTPSKKRKLDDTATPPPTKPGALNAITSAISGVFGFGRPALNGLNGLPNPYGQIGSGGPVASPRPAIKLSALKGTIWDTTVQKPRLESKKAATPRSTRTTKSPGKKTPASQRRGATVNDSPSKSRSAKRENEEAEVDDELSAAEPGSAQKPAAAKRLWAAGAASPAPKSILSPTKRRGRPPKSVSFNKAADGEVFFDDLPKSASAKKTPARRPKAQEEEVVEEIVCGICSKPHSRAPNEIILCDNCDFAVHQLCYGLEEVPKGDWLCKSCDQEDVLKVTKDSVLQPAAQPVELPEIPNLERHIKSYQRILLDRCAGRRRIEMFGHEEAHEKAKQLVEQTVVAGEGNSMLLIGARGSGKTTMLENIITDLSAEHGRDFHVVRLNGFIHTDDKLALKEIWRQLGKEMDVEDDLMNRTNYADTMASLLALLSHPSEIMGTDEGVTSQSVVFIIDEFDMFAAHPRQTLLYNLFDTAQSRKAPIAVLGCTTRLDVVEMLEKRVKSRFSHRYVYLPQPKTLPAYWQLCKQGLVIDRESVEKEGIDTTIDGYDEFHKYWGAKIDDLYRQRAFQELLQYHFYTTKSASAFFTEWVLPLASLSPTNLALSVPKIAAEETSLAPPDSRVHLLSTLSDLELSLLIAAARLDIIAHTDTVNFAMAYDEYSSLVGRQRVQSASSGLLAAANNVRVWNRGVAGIAWERLVQLGILVPSGLGGGKSLGQGGLEGRMWKVDVALEEIPGAAKLGPVLAKWCREI